MPQGTASKQQTTLVDSGQTRLLQLGYKQELARTLPWSRNGAICLQVMCAPLAVTGLYGQGFAYGGPVTLIWGWVIASIFTFAIALSLAEIASSFPVSGGLYFFSYQLARSRAAFACWLTGWMNLVGQVTLVAAAMYTCVQLLATIVLLSTGTAAGGGYAMSNFMCFYVYVCLIIACAALNTLPIDLSARIAWYAAWWQVISVIGFCSALVTVTPVKQDLSYLFTSFQYNPASGITSTGYTFLLGLLTACWSLVGYDASAHLMEETMQSDRKGAIAMLYAVGITIPLGFLLIFSLTLCAKDPASVLDPANATAGLAVVAQIIWDAFIDRFGSGNGALLMLTVLFADVVLCVWFVLTSASRMLYAFSRDDAVPFSKVFRYVHPASQTPLGAVAGVSVSAVLLGLTLLDSFIAFAAVTSVAVISLNLSYGFPIFLRLFVARSRFAPGPFSLGRWSYVIGGAAVTWILFVTAIFVMPTVFPVTKLTFNYAGPAVGAVLVLSVGWWFLHARTWFSGPEPNIDNSDAVFVNYLLTDPPRAC